MHLSSSVSSTPLRFFSFVIFLFAGPAFAAQSRQTKDLQHNIRMYSSNSNIFSDAIGWTINAIVKRRKLRIC
jgi:hypothetical protein